MKWLRRSIQILILLTFIAYSQFYKLGTYTLRTWDEARLATNAYEMAKSGNLIVTTVWGEPDMWNSKPPLMIWAQAACIKLHGFSEISVRFPSALCAALTIMMVALFVFYLTRSSWCALLAGLVLCTAKGYIDNHGTRYGEYDSMLTFFSCAYIFSFFIYTESTGKKRDRWLIAFFIFLTAAVLTKGVAGMLLTPAIFLYALFNKQVIPTLTNWFFYAGIAGFLFFVGGYYFLHEHYTPGYLEAVKDNELGGRFNVVKEGSSGPWTYYWYYLRDVQFGNWYWALPASLVVVWFVERPRAKRAMQFCFFSAIWLVVILSFSKTKIFWYDLPVFPLFAVTIALLLWELANVISSVTLFPQDRILMLLTVIFTAQPVWELYNFIKWSGDDLSKSEYVSLGYFFRDAIHGKRDISNSTYVVYDYTLQWDIYANKLNDMGAHLKRESYTGANKFWNGQKVITNYDGAKSYIEKNYEYRLIEHFYGVNYYMIIGPKT
jgi:4-amino-4-deoxy-L-arabinose transferase-like glycosyltransferase